MGGTERKRASVEVRVRSRVVDQVMDDSDCTHKADGTNKDKSMFDGTGNSKGKNKW